MLLAYKCFKKAGAATCTHEGGAACPHKSRSPSLNGGLAADDMTALLKPGLPEKTHWDGLTIAMLKMELERRGLSTGGSKKVLVDRLNALPESQRDSFEDLKPGIQGITETEIATARVSRMLLAHFPTR